MIISGGLDLSITRPVRRPLNPFYLSQPCVKYLIKLGL